MVDKATGEGGRKAYCPSWIDRFHEWVERLPVRAWIVYAALGIALILVQELFLWLDGGIEAVSLLPAIIYNALVIPYIIALIHLLDNQAAAALDFMRPTLALEEPDLSEFQYKLANMPPRGPLIVGLTMATFLVITEQFGIVPIRYAALEALPVFRIVYHFFDKIAAILAGAFIYHTISQLRLVNTIYSSHTRINLFDLKPLYTFSRLTASTAVALVVFVYAWMIINPELLTDPLGLGGMVALTVLAVSVFVWPLLGAHRLMEQEKQRILRELDLGFEAVFSKFNEGLDRDDYAAVGRLNGTIASLEIQRNRISAIPTWPWRPEIARFALTAIALPLALSILRFLVERAFGW